MNKLDSLKVVELDTSEDNVFISRFPLLNNSLCPSTRILVRTNQVAVFVDNTTILDVLSEGSYNLTPDNLPLAKQHFNWDKRFNSQFVCDIYFVTLTLFENLKWGMVNSLIIRDNDFGSVAIKCFGNFSFQVTNAKTFMTELFGKISQFNNEDISLYLRTLIVAGITEMLLDTRMSALDFVTNYDIFTIEDFRLTRNKFAGCGLLLQRLNIESISIPEEIEKLLNIKVLSSSQSNLIENNLPINHPYNSGSSYTDEMKKMFNFTKDLTIECIHCGAVISKNFKHCPQCGKENKEIAKECPNCHNVVAFKANFCPDCGTQLFDKNNVVLCKHCGRIVNSDDAYCPDCGKPI